MDLKKLIDLSILPIGILMFVSLAGVIILPFLYRINGDIDFRIWVFAIIVTSLFVYSLIIIKSRPELIKEVIEKLP